MHRCVIRAVPAARSATISGSNRGKSLHRLVWCNANLSSVPRWKTPMGVCHQHQTLFHFSTASSETTPAAPRRKASLNAVHRNRKRAKERNKQKVAQTLDRPTLLKAETRARSEFETLFSEFLEIYPPAQLRNELQALQVLGQSHDNDETPLVNVFRDSLDRAATDLSKALLKALLYGTSPSSTRNSTSEKTSSEQLKALIRAREHLLDHRWPWGPADAKQWAELSPQERERIVGTRRTLHQAKSAQQRKREAYRFLQFLRQSLPLPTYRSVMNLLSQKQDETAAKNNNKDKVSHTSMYLGGSVARRGRIHYRTIAEEIANFFYLNDGGVEFDVVALDSKVKTSKTIFSAAQSQFVDTMSDLERLLLKSIQKNPSAVTQPSNLSGESISEEDLPDELLSPSRLKVPQVSQSTDKRFRKPRHFQYEAVALLEDVANQNKGTNESRIVFLDNLPIDITEAELRELYSRCGDVDDVKIFNLRPELDPVDLSHEQRRRLRKAQLASTRGNPRRWQRPRSPVYAQLTFSNETGSQRTLVDSLRIFGMVIRRHPVRSIRPSDMTKLYLEDLPEGMTAEDFEFWLNQELQPEFLICPNDDQNQRAVAGSCEIAFANFATAYHSYTKLLQQTQQVHESLAIHWMRTPSDADKWWKREVMHL